jgi:hypothetical protein
LQFSWSLSYAFLQAISCQVLWSKDFSYKYIWEFWTFKTHRKKSSKEDVICSIRGSTIVGGEGDFLSFFLYFDVYSWLREMV